MHGCRREGRICRRIRRGGRGGWMADRSATDRKSGAMKVVIHRSVQLERIATTLEAREQAEEVLQRLLVDRRLSEQRFEEAGKRDPLKDLTGTSALDRAIQSTRQMIEHLDELIAGLEASLPSANGTATGTPVVLQPSVRR